MRTRPLLSLGVLTTVITLGMGLGCSGRDDAREGDYTAPPGFTLQQTRQATLHPGAFVRGTDRRLVSSTVLNRLTARQAKSLDLRAKSPDPRDDFRIETTFGDSYAEGLTVATSRQPQAYLRVIPRNAQKAPGRVRSDGALIAFEGAYPNVTSAFGGRQSKVEEFLSIPSEADIPSLAYDLVPGPEFGNFVTHEGTLWAFAKDGNGLFAIAPPVADDAAGKRVTGSWKLEDTHGKYVLTAQIELRGLRFPVLLDPSFEVPQWWITASPAAPSARAGAAGTYDASQQCAVLFGGATAAFDLLSDTYARCSSDQQWSSAFAATSPPEGRAYAALAHLSTSGKTTLFGGFGVGGALDDMYELTFSCPGGSSTCSGSWSQVTKSGSWPAARYMHGAASDGTNLIIWGGIDAAGAGLTDTWKWDGSTWTEICSDCFMSPRGLYGLAPATTVTAGGTRTIYSVGGYNDPTSATGQFTNNVFRFTGSGWDDVSASPSNISLDETGAISGTQSQPAERNLHWASATQDNNLIIGSGLQTSATGVDTYYTDSWLWLSGPSAWLRAPHPTTSIGDVGPGLRESATAIFDETNRNIVLFGGLDSTQNAQQNAVVYKGQAHNITVTQSCPDIDLDQACDNSDYVLSVVLDGVGATDCASFEVKFLKYNNLTLLWEEDSTLTPSFGADCRVSQTYAALDTSTYVDFGVRVHDIRMYDPAFGVCGATAGEISGGGKPGCLVSGSTLSQGSAVCGGLVDLSIPGLETIDCTSY